LDLAPHAPLAHPRKGRAMTQHAQPGKVTMRHYQALCGLALATVFLLQLQHHAAFLFNVLLLFIGSLCILIRLRFSPLLVFLVFAAGQAFEQFQLRRFGLNFQFLHLTDVMLCMAMLTYMIGQYRLNGLRFGVLIDSRAGVNPARSVDSLSAAEILGLIFPVPLCALAGQAAMLLLARHWGPSGMTPVWQQLFLLAWTFLLGMFLAAHAFRHWGRLQMTRAMALVMLQDILWSEIGGEQRRIERWNAWRKRNS
jgi:hypothetical protein